jgi:glutamate dehydrogenase
VLLAYAKTSLYSDLLDSDLPEDPGFAGDLAKYFPRPLRRQYPEAIAGHRLRREIIATCIVNSMINRVGPGFIDDIREESEATAADIARAYAATREIHDLRRLWTEIEALDNKVPAQLQTAMMLETVPLTRSGTLWCLRELPGRIDIAATVNDFAEQRALLAARLDQLLAEPARVRLAKRAEAYAAEGAPAALARAVASLETMMAAQDIIAAAKRAGQPVETVGKAYFTLGDRLGLDWLRQAAAEVNLPGRWQRLAMNAALEELAVQQRRLTIPVLRQLGEGTADPVLAVERWQAVLGSALARLNRLIAEFKTAGGVDAARLAIANRYVRALSVE